MENITYSVRIRMANEVAIGTLYQITSKMRQDIMAKMPNENNIHRCIKICSQVRPSNFDELYELVAQ